LFQGLTRSEQLANQVVGGKRRWGERFIVGDMVRKRQTSVKSCIRFPIDNAITRPFCGARRPAAGQVGASGSSNLQNSVAGRFGCVLPVLCLSGGLRKLTVTRF